MENQETKEQLQIRIDLALTMLSNSKKNQLIKSVLTTAKIVKCGNPFKGEKPLYVFGNK